MAPRLDRLFRISALDSTGILYSLITLHLGFDFNADEYKAMGLGPYGDATRFRRFFEEAVALTPDAGFRIPGLEANDGAEARERYLATRGFLTAQLGPARSPEDEITDVHRDVAAALQECLDRVLLHLCGHFGAATGQRRLALAGGVALNCTANGRLLQAGLFDEIYVQPAAGDDGSALGAALWRAAQGGAVRNERLPLPVLGPAYGRAGIAAAPAACGDRVEAVEREARAAAV